MISNESKSEKKIISSVYTLCEWQKSVEFCDCEREFLGVSHNSNKQKKATKRNSTRRKEEEEGEKNQITYIYLHIRILNLNECIDFYMSRASCKTQRDIAAAHLLF